MMNGKKDLNCHSGTAQGVFYRRRAIFRVISLFALLNNTRPILNKYHLLLGCWQGRIFGTCFATVSNVNSKPGYYSAARKAAFLPSFPVIPLAISDTEGWKSPD